jgi:hypothetical protein
MDTRRLRPWQLRCEKPAAPRRANSRTERALIDYKTLSTTRHKLYDADYCGKIRVLYEGAKTLWDALQSPTRIRQEIFPPHLGEEPDVYAERIKRSCYVNYMSQLVDYIVSTLFSDPVRVTAGGGDEDMKPGSVEPFYDDFYRNTAHPAARPVSFNETLRRVVLDALLFRRAWLLVEFPKKPLDDAGVPVTPTSRYDEELLEAGGEYRRAYCCSVDPECVYDWEKSEDGELAWAMVHDKDYPRATVDAKRTLCVETFTVYDRTSWTRYVWEYDDEKSKPKDSDGPTRTESGKHDFGCVPLLSFEIPCGLWAGGKMENIAVELFNKLSALSWGQYRSLFQIVAVTLQTPDPKDGFNPIAEDTRRAVNQTMGPGRVWVGAERDQIRYIGPDTAPFAEARAYLSELRDEMHRVLHQMAQAVDNSGAGLKRSGESKKMDQAAGAIVSRELGRIFRDVTVTIYTTVAAGRNERDKIWSVSGLESYDEVGTAELVVEAVQLEQVNVPSPTWQAIRKHDLAIKLTPGLTDEQKDKIYEELEENITAAQAAAMQPPGGPVQPGASTDDAGNMDDGAAGTEAVDAVYQQLADDFEPDAIAWVKNASWELKNVPLDQIDFSGRAKWKASKHADKITRFTGKIKSGDKKPIILVVPPGGGKYRVADGHHRALAYKQLGQPARAYVATVDAEGFRAAMEMHSEQLDQDSNGTE